VVEVRWEATTNDTITLDFSAAPPNNSRRVEIKGPGTQDYYSATIGNGTDSTINLDHNLGTRSVVTVVRNAAAPYEVVEVEAYAPSLDRVTLDFSAAPTANSLVASVYAPSIDYSHESVIGDGSTTEFTITHDLNTRDIGVICRNTSSPYDFTVVKWEATTVNTAKIIFTVAPSTNSRKITIFNSFGGARYYNNEVTLDMLDDVTITSASNGQFLSWNGTNWVNSSAPGGAGISSLDDVPGVTISSATSGDFLKYNGSAWVNDPINLSTDTTGSYVASLVAGTGIELSNNSGEGATPTVSLNASLDNLSDVVITSPEEFQSLTYNGTNWVNNYASVVSYVQNAEATTLTTGTCVYLYGGTGDHASVKRADNGSDTTSSKTIGVVGANIASSQNGPIITRGYVDGINLSTGYSVGDVLWLGENGAFTKTKPSAPDHLVFVGVVVRATNNGLIYVATQNGYELDELHDVSIVDKASGDFLKYNGTLWVNDPINLGTDTVGNYMSNVSAGTGIAVSHTPGEGSTATISIESTAWTSYTPTITADGGGFALNNGTLTGRYKQIGKTVFFSLKFVFGSTTAAGTGHWNFSLPVTAYDSNFTFSAAILDDSVAWYGGIGNGNYTGSTSSFAVIIPGTSASVTTWASVGNGGPFIWGTGDNITITGSYEAA